MARESLVTQVANDLLDRIMAGEFPPNSLLPGENELTISNDVSRLTVREAVKTLEARGVVRVERGRGTYVNPTERWTSIEAVLRASIVRDTIGTATQLIELRRILETAAAGLAASRMTPAALAELDRLIDLMRQADRDGDVPVFVAADIDFHDAILRATGNPFISVIFEPIKKVLRVHREATSQVPAIRVNAMNEHARILVALRSAEPERARWAMDSHINQTLADIRHHLGAPEPDAKIL